MNQQLKAREAVRCAASYLRSCGIRLPRFRLTTEWASLMSVGGSHVHWSGRSYHLNMGRYPTTFLRHWFAMHELGHLLWLRHDPLRRKGFRTAFGDPLPPDYDSLHRRESWKTPLALQLYLPRRPGPHRPAGEPSWYGARAGGEERFCELIGLMYAHGDFSKEPPDDLADLWDCCWEHGLSRMT
jgi:hypothetical protein